MEVIGSFNDSRIVVHSNPVNMGQTKSLNVGLRMAKGKYVARMDADDMAYPNWIAHLIELYKKYPLCAAVGSSAIVINSQGKIKEIRKAPVYWQDILFRHFFAPPMNHVSTLLNKDIILKHGGYDEDFNISQDFELWSSLIRKGYKLANSSAILVAYRVHASSLSASNLNGRGLQEKAETLFRNVLSMTDAVLTREDALRINRFLYNVTTLTEDEFHNSRKQFEIIYKKVKAPICFPQSFIDKKMKQQMLIPYCKFAFKELQNSNLKVTRSVCLDFFKQYGFHAFPFLIILFSVSSTSIASKLDKWFEKYRELKAVLTIKKDQKLRRIRQYPLV
jgi:glycosyltransferase involved in cell wall biosynthesis